MPLVKPRHSILALALLWAPQAAYASDFGNEGSVQLGVDRVMGVFLERQSTKTSSMGVESELTTKSTTAGVLALDGETVAGLPRLTLDYFLAPQISVGGAFIYTTSSASAVFSSENNPSDTESELGSRSIFALHPRAGYNVPFNDTWGVWPRAGLLFANQSATQTVSVDANGDEVQTTRSAATLALTLDGMFYATPVEHLIIMAGPFLDLGFWGSGSVETDGSPNQDFDAGLTAFGLSFALGAYF